jgi:hypothetical protein
MKIMMGRSLNELFEGKVLTWKGAAGVVVFVLVMAIREREMAKELSSILDFPFTARLHPQYALFSSTYGTLYIRTPKIQLPQIHTYVHTYILLTKKLPLKIPPISKRILFALPSLFFF